MTKYIPFITIACLILTGCKKTSPPSPPPADDPVAAYSYTLKNKSAQMDLESCALDSDKVMDSSEKEKSVRISTKEDPQTLDPRLAESIANTTFIKMFYEGLMVQGKDGEILPGVAREVNVSENGKIYTFHLRDCNWSNGDPVTAHDFAASWKSVLAPDFPAPMASQLFLIKGAKEAKEGTLPLEEVGIAAKDDKTLVVELNEPAPHFLELTTFNVFCPVHQEWAKNPSTLPIANGPFQLESWVKSAGLQAVKNPNYWDAGQVRIDKIYAMVLEDENAWEMFQAGKLDWIGAPLSSLPASTEDSVESQTAAGVHYLSFNTSKAPFDNLKVRKALSLSLNRSDIVAQITQGEKTPAAGFVPLSHDLEAMLYFDNQNIEAAKELLSGALVEMGCTLDQLPKITLTFASHELSNKVAKAVQQQWKEALGIDIALEACESKGYNDRLKEGNYSVSMKSWYGDFKDPTTFLEIFNHKCKNPDWESQQYMAQLNLSKCIDENEICMDILDQAEQLLLTETPAAPLYYKCYNYVKNEQLKEVLFSEFGYLDFKHAEIN